MQQSPLFDDGIYYPDSDGKPMADNDWQWDWIVWIKNAVAAVLGDRAYVGSDLFWYPVRGNNKVKIAPDVLVAFGRPLGRRRSYLQWREDDVIPVIVFEVLSHENTPAEMAEKRRFYERHGVEEYYELDPVRETILGWLRQDDRLLPAGSMVGRPIDRLGVTFVKEKGALVIVDAGGEALGDYQTERRARRIAELRARSEERRADALEARVDEADERAEAERERAEAERARAEAAERRLAQLEALLKERGIGPTEQP